MEKVVVICGPTAVGKTKLGVELASLIQTDIINGDAFQIYQNLHIGVAKPSLEEMKGITHHLMDFIPSEKTFNVCDYQKLVRDKIAFLVSEQKLPIIVGGTGLYIDSVITNYEFSDQKRENDFDELYKDYSNEQLYTMLKNINPINAENIHMNNRKRVLRALELSINGLTKSKKNNELLYDVLVILLNDERDKLYDRINKRVDNMIAAGLIEEVKYLYENNLFSQTSIKAIGYKEIIDYLNNNLSLEEAINKIKQNSRHYAKRQLTWFKNKSYVTEVMVDVDDFNKTIKLVYEKICNFLNDA